MSLTLPLFLSHSIYIIDKSERCGTHSLAANKNLFSLLGEEDYCIVHVNQRERYGLCCSSCYIMGSGPYLLYYHKSMT